MGTGLALGRVGQGNARPYRLRKSGTHPELVPPPQAPRAQASLTPLACQLWPVFRKTEPNAASWAGVWTSARREYRGFWDALGTVEAHGPWTAQLHAQALLWGSGLKASTWLCPEMATGGTLEFGGVPVQKP